MTKVLAIFYKGVWLVPIRFKQDSEFWAWSEFIMVFYFTSNVVDPSAFIYVGKDKVESESYSTDQIIDDGWCPQDEDLIKFGWDEDVW